MAKQKSIYDLELHETLKIQDYDVIRVPGGWVYRVDPQYYKEGSDGIAVFVPYNKEFKDK